jgi:hypothetical protein
VILRTLDSLATEMALNRGLSNHHRSAMSKASMLL